MELEKIILFTLKFHLLDHMGEQISRFSDLRFLDASLTKTFNFVMETF